MNAVRSKSPRRAASRRPVRDNKPESILVREQGLKRLRRFASLNSKIKAAGNPEIIHDVRVANRRLQQILDYLYPAPRPSAIRRLRKRLRGLRQALGEVRDYDVLIASIDGRLKFEKSTQHPVLTAIHKRLMKHRAKLLQKARTDCDKFDPPDLCENLRVLLRNVEGPARTEETHPNQLDVAVKQLWRDVANSVSKSLRKPRPANLHRARIKIKRLRYLLEVSGDLGHSDIETPLMCLRQLQQHLGNWHDLEVQEAIMSEIIPHLRIPNGKEGNEEFMVLTRELHIAKADAEWKYADLVRNDRAWKLLRQWMVKHTKTPRRARGKTAAVIGN